MENLYSRPPVTAAIIHNDDNRLRVPYTMASQALWPSPLLGRNTWGSGRELCLITLFVLCSSLDVQSLSSPCSSIQKKCGLFPLMSAWNHYLSCSQDHPPNYFSGAALTGFFWTRTCSFTVIHFLNSVSPGWVSCFLCQYILGDDSIPISLHCINSYVIPLIHL